MEKKLAEKKTKDPLLACLVIYTKLYNKPYSAEALTEGLPVENGIDSIELFSAESSKSLFSRASKRAGFSSSLVKKDLATISSLVLPCILILKGRQACILQSFNKDKSKAKIITPELEGENWVNIEVLESEYLGYCFFLKKEFAPEDHNNHLINSHSEHWFWGTVKKSKKIYFDVILASIVINLFVLASPMFTMNVYDRVVPNNATDTLWVLAVGVGVVFLIDLFLKFTRSYFLEIAGKKSDIIMSSLIFEQVLDMQMANRPKSVGSFASNLRDFDSIKNFFTSSTMAAFVDLPFVFIFIAVIYFIAGLLVIVPICVTLMILLYTIFVRKPLQKSIESTYKAAAMRNGILIESLNSMETIKTMGAAGNSQWQWEEATGEIANRSIKSKILSTSITTITSFLGQFNTIIVVLVGVYMIKDMQLTMGGLIATMILSGRVIAPMGQVASLISSYEQTKTAYKSLDDIMKMPVERPEGKQFIRRDKLEGKIEFKDVSFKYPETSKGALEKVSFTINAGEKVGLIGRNGSGKTTIEKLILGLFSPDEGSVLIDGIDIKQIDPADLRKNIGYVPQDVVLFKGTVRQNIVFKAPYVDDVTIVKAAKISGVDEFVNNHPQGFDLPVGERGDGISGGQKQSIAVARAFLLDFPIMLLDEPTNFMDSTSEVKLEKNLKENLEHKTTVLVTHKTSLLALVDRLIVVDNGKVVLDGPKKEVLDKLSGKRV